MANWSHTQSQGWGDFSEGWEATINGTKFSIVVDERTRKGTLYRSAPGGASTKVKDGSVDELKRYAETHRFSRPGEKDMMAKTESFTVRQKDGSSVTYKTDPLTAESLRRLWKLAIDAGASVPQGFNAMLASGIKTGKILRASRPGAKATFKVEDRFYFGKGRKERFADDAKQIADTILKQLGGGRFIAMTGAKNLAYRSSPPGLSMSIGRGAKDAIKYLRVDYDRGSDTYTMIFSNKSGSTVKSVNHVYADSLQRVFTSTTGFDTHL
jgi:hypothetical protein